MRKLITVGKIYIIIAVSIWIACAGKRIFDYYDKVMNYEKITGIMISYSLGILMAPTIIVLVSILFWTSYDIKYDIYKDNDIKNVTIKITIFALVAAIGLLLSSSILLFFCLTYIAFLIGKLKKFNVSPISSGSKGESVYK